MIANLNELTISNDGPRPGWQKLADNSAVSTNGSVKVHFRDLEQRIVDHIRHAQVVVGCVAWLTSDVILRALACVPKGVSIVVQKEDFLRPDISTKNNWKATLQRMYAGLKQPLDRFAVGGIVGELSVCTDSTIDPVRCVGNHNRDKKPAFPRMHNKFLVFCDVDETDPRCGFGIRPHTVWTGSFNLTRNAGMSLENALVLTDLNVVLAYFHEWEQILALSEPLDWDSDWCAPQWRVGT